MKSIFEFENLFTSIQTTQEIGDDFSTMFSSFYLKIFTGFLFFGVIFYNTILSVFLIQFEKFGNDPMKRSVTNLIASQINYIALLSNIFFSPFLTWRVIIGPIQPNLTGTFYFCLIVTQSRSPFQFLQFIFHLKAYFLFSYSRLSNMHSLSQLTLSVFTINVSILGSITAIAALLVCHVPCVIRFETGLKKIDLSQIMNHCFWTVLFKQNKSVGL